MADFSRNRGNELIVHPSRSGGSQTVLYLEPMNNGGNPPEQEGSFSLQIGRVIQQRLPWIVGALLLGCLLGFGFSLRQTPIYEARLSVEIQNPAEADPSIKVGDEAEYKPRIISSDPDHHPKEPDTSPCRPGPVAQAEFPFDLSAREPYGHDSQDSTVVSPSDPSLFGDVRRYSGDSEYAHCDNCLFFARSAICGGFRERAGERIYRCQPEGALGRDQHSKTVAGATTR